MLRELCSVLSKGTRTYCYLEENGEENGDTSGPLLLSIKEHIAEAGEGSSDPVITYGICILDPTTATFRLGQFEDDPQG